MTRRHRLGQGELPVAITAGEEVDFFDLGRLTRRQNPAIPIQDSVVVGGLLGGVESDVDFLTVLRAVAVGVGDGGIGIVFALLEIAETVAVGVGAFRVGADPDDVVLPVVTNTCDVLGVLVLFGVVRLFV